MDPLHENATDLEEFAGRLGIKGSDFDLFYETYYNMDTEAGEEARETQETLAEMGY